MTAKSDSKNYSSQLAEAEAAFMQTMSFKQAVRMARRTEVSDQESAVTDFQAQRTDETLPQLEARVARLGKAIQDRRDTAQQSQGKARRAPIACRRA